MTHVISALRVSDYPQWKRSFDEGSALRRSFGMHSYRIFQTVDDPNSIVLFTEYDSPDAARKFLQSPELRAAQQDSGVVEHCDTFDTSRFLIEVDSG